MEFLGLLEIPEVCDNCKSLNIEYTENKKLYGSNVGEWPYMYYCNRCEAATGCHAGTKFPLGKMARKDVRVLRVEAHEVFDKLWKTGAMTRTKAYSWLSFEMGIEFEKCHIGWMSRDELKKVIVISKEYFDRYQFNLLRRKAKQNDRNEKNSRRSMERDQRVFEKHRKHADKRHKFTKISRTN